MPRHHQRLCAVVVSTLVLLGAIQLVFPSPLGKTGGVMPILGPAPQVTLAVTAVALLLIYLLRTILDGGERIPLGERVVIPLQAGLLVVAPIGLLILLRQSTPGPEVLAFTHDGGVIHTEAAARALISGLNPYSINYQDTILSHGVVQGILDHYPYPPATFLIPAPLIALHDAAGLPFDQRLVYVALYLAMLALIPRLLDRPLLQAIGLAVLALNPVLVNFLRWGTNDIYLLASLTFALWALKTRRPVLLGLALGLSLGLKQFAWVLLPFFLLVARHQLERSSFRRMVAVTAGLTALIFVPFALWAPGDFMDDLLLFNAGLTENAYPLGGTPGIGLSMLIATRGWVTDLTGPFPNGLLVLVFAGPVFVLGLRSLARDPRLHRLCFFGAGLLMTLLFFARFFHANYVALIVQLLVLGVLLEWNQEPESSPE